MIKPQTGSDLFPCDNNFAHLTLLLGSYVAKDSNNVLNQLFDKGNIATDDLTNIFESNNSYSKKFEVKVNNEIVNAYVIKLIPEIKLVGISKVY